MEFAGEQAVNDAFALPRRRFASVGVQGLRVLVQDVEGGDEELVRVVLLVAGQVLGVLPDQVQHAARDEGLAVPVVELLNRLGKSNVDRQHLNPFSTSQMLINNS